jgi:hypothetical protein
VLDPAPLANAGSLHGLLVRRIPQLSENRNFLGRRGAEVRGSYLSRLWSILPAECRSLRLLF